MKGVIEKVEKGSTLKRFNGKEMFKIANIMILTLMFILGVSSTGVCAAELNNTPFGVIVKGMENASKANTIYSTSKAKMTLDTSISKDPNLKILSNMIKNISVESKVKTNNITKEACYDMVFKFNDVATVNARMYVKDENNIVISVPELYSRPICYSVSEVHNPIKNNGVKLNTINMDNYKALFTMDKPKELQALNEKYSKMLSDGFNQLIQPKGEVVLNTENIKGEKAQVKCNQYSVNMTLNDASSILNNLLTNISQDGNFKNLLKVKLDEISTVVDKNNDYASLGLTKEMVKEIKTNFDKTYTTVIEGLKNLIIKMNQGCELKVSSNILIDSNNMLRASNGEFYGKVNDMYILNMTSEGVINSVNENLTIDTISTLGALDLFKASKAEQDEMEKQVKTNMIRIFGSVLSINK